MPYHFHFSPYTDTGLNSSLFSDAILDILPFHLFPPPRVRPDLEESSLQHLFRRRKEREVYEERGVKGESKIIKLYSTNLKIRRVGEKLTDPYWEINRQASESEL
jgi:hypothetical protein